MVAKKGRNWHESKLSNNKNLEIINESTQTAPEDEWDRNSRNVLRKNTDELSNDAHVINKPADWSAWARRITAQSTVNMQAHEVDRYCDSVWESRERHRTVACHTWMLLHLKGLKVTSSEKTATMITCTESPLFWTNFALLRMVPWLWIRPKMELWLSEHNYTP